MGVKINLLILILLLAGCSSTRKVKPAFSQFSNEKSSISPAQAEKVAEVLSQFSNESEIAIALLQDGKTTFFGMKRQQDTLIPLENRTHVFEIGSITKVLTTQLLINTLNQGKIPNLDAPIALYAPFPIKGNPEITFKQLANHSSGLLNDIVVSIFGTQRSNPYQKWDREKLRKFLAEDAELEQVPGEKYLYSNIGIAVLAQTICEIQASDYESLVQEEIFRPLKMTHSTTKRADVLEFLVPGQNWKGKPTENWDLAALEGVGAVLSTTEDLSRYLNWGFDAFQRDYQLMAQSTLKINDNLDIALGWHIVKGKTNTPFLWHNGGTGGYKSSMGMNLSNRIGVVILTNIGATNNPKRGLIDQLCFDLMQVIEE